MTAAEPAQHKLDDLAVWRTSLPDVQFAILPPSTDRPNPRLSGGRLFASVLSPGCAYALDAATGEICWRRELPYHGDQSIELSGEALFLNTSQCLYALDLVTGSVRWGFSPYGAQGETLYSAPVLDGKRVFFGDRVGWFYCLDAETGQTIWKRKASDVDDDQVNAAAFVVAGLAITATNAGLVLAFSVADGEPVWQSKLDGPCAHQLFLIGDQLIAAAQSLYFLDPLTGEFGGRVQWPGFSVSFAAGTPSKVALFRQESRDELTKTDESGDPEPETLLLFEGTRLVREIRCSPCASDVRFSPSTGLLYVSGLGGLDILNPDTGEWLHALESAHGIGLVEVTENRIYAMDMRGVVRALRHPGRSPS